MFQVVVSSENSLYMAWQTQLFCMSAWNVLAQRPIVIVHDTGTPLRPEFCELAEHGCRIVRAPAATQTRNGMRYPPRNELASLREVGSLGDLDADSVLFCEPDMIFVRPVSLPGELTAEFYSYLDYREARVTAVAAKYNLLDIERLNARYRVGVPYLIPRCRIPCLASRWMEVLDAFDELRWIDIMYAFGLALDIEGENVEQTHLMTDNYRPTRPLRHLIHYCFGDDVWDKRSFRNTSPFDLPDEQLQRGVSGTVLGEIMAQLRQAKRIFRGMCAERSSGTPNVDSCLT